MLIRKPLSEVKDTLITFLDEGFGLLGYGFQNRHEKIIVDSYADWTHRVMQYFESIFPTKKEAGQFWIATGNSYSYQDMDKQVEATINSLDRRLKVIERILDSVDKYYSFEPDNCRIFIQSIDSFQKVRGVNHSEVDKLLSNGFFDISEEKVKENFIKIIGQSYIATDWGGETEDIYTSYIVLNGERVQTSILLKGKGTIKGNETHLGNLGKNGDQLTRMMSRNTSKLYVIQSVKPIAEDIIITAETFVARHRSLGHLCYFCTIDGQDTATLFYAYGLT